MTRSKAIGTIVCGLLLTLGLVGPSFAAAAVLFDGSRKSAWRLNQSASANRIVERRDPHGSRDTVLRFTVRNSDVAPLTPTADPRAQLVSPQIIKPGQQAWVSMQILLPKNFPVRSTYRDGWLSLGSPYYGPPFDGSPPVELGIKDGSFIYTREPGRPGSDAYSVILRRKLILGRWVRITWHFKAANDGWVELYIDDRPQRLRGSPTADRRRLPLAVIDQSNAEGPPSSQLSLYYQRGMFDRLTVYYKNFRIATTKSTAEK